MTVGRKPCSRPPVKPIPPFGPSKEKKGRDEAKGQTAFSPPVLVSSSSSGQNTPHSRSSSPEGTPRFIFWRTWLYSYSSSCCVPSLEALPPCKKMTCTRALRKH